MLERPMELSDSEAEFDRLFAAHSPRLVVSRVDTSSEEEEEMALNLRRGLKDLVVGRNKGLSSKEASKTQLPPNLALPPLLPVTTVKLLLCPDLKKKRKVQEVEEGEVVPLKGAKQPKNAKDKRASSVDNRKDPVGVEVRRRQRTWAPRLELDGAAIP